ncbi:MAG: transposase [Bacteroidales bacterium]|nr:transposase [Candidatus Latescibacterota bacterium]
MKYTLQMLGKNENWQEEMITVPGMTSLVPKDHILYKVNSILKTGWFREEVRELYCETNGRPSIDPESALRLMLAGFLHGIKHDRKLLREAQVNIAIRWFCGFGLVEELPHHSSLTRIRQRWGVETFLKVFQNIVKQCGDAGLLSNEMVHVDSTMIEADASLDSVVKMYVEEVIKKNDDDVDNDDSEPPSPANEPKKERRSKTDPDASFSRTNKRQQHKLGYKQHTVVDDKAGVVVDVHVTTGKTNDGPLLIEQIQRVARNTGVMPNTVTADAAYAISDNYRLLEEMGIDPVIPPQPERKQGKSMPIRRFKYDWKHHVVRCPGNKKLGYVHSNKQGWVFKAKTKDCKCCPLKNQCVPPSGSARSILIVYGYTSLLRGRRRTQKRWLDNKFFESYKRHKWLVEGRQGEAKVQHGLRRAHRRGLAQVSIQVYMTAIAMNMKRLAAFLLHQNPLLKAILGRIWHLCAIPGDLFAFSYSKLENRKTRLAALV